MSEKFGGFKDLQVWQKSVDLSIMVYELTKKYPSTEIYGLTNQTRRAVVSIPSNIAEGQCRATTKDFLHFLRIAYASGAELETQLIIAGRLGYADNESIIRAQGLLEEVVRMLAGLMKSLHAKQ